MQNIPDLHTHSTFSDGTLPPGELLEIARAAGVSVLALTDHDTTDGLAEAKAAAARLNVQLVGGVEISVTWLGRTVHVVGLGVDPGCEMLQTGLAAVREFRDWRAGEIARRLDRHGIEGAYEGALGFSGSGLVSRTHFARWLVARGYSKDLKTCFKSFLVQGKPGHVPGRWAGLEDAVSWIIAAGGQAVLAHPARYRFSGTRLRELLGAFQDCGGVGLEVVSGSHSRGDCLQMAHYARTFGFLASAGSDYHGPEQSWLNLGRLPLLPDGCKAIWSDWIIPEPADFPRSE